MVSRLEGWVRRLVATRVTPPAASATGPDAPGTRLVGPAEEVRRLRVVRPGTVAVLTTPGAEPRLRAPGELLVPPLLAPGAPRVLARAFSTAPVELDVTATDLVTFDGHPVDRVVLRLTLELDGTDGYADLLGLVERHPDDVEAELLAAVHREAVAAVRGAVRMNRLADLQRLSLATVLEGRWLPDRFGVGTLRCRQLRVQRVRWPGEDEPTVPVVVPGPAQAASAR